MTRGRDGSTIGELLLQSKALNPPDRLSWHAWREIVGSKIAQRSRPAQVERQTLTIIVSSSTWAQELSLLTTTILERVRVKLPAVRVLRFQVGVIEAPEVAQVRNRVQPVTLPPDLESRIARVEDESLRRILRDAASFNLALPWARDPSAK
jgi:hypothetical protein